MSETVNSGNHYKINRPVPFGGTVEEAQKNYDTHQWVNYDGEPVCMACDCKWWYESSRYPCGAEIPREVVDTDDVDGVI